MRGKVSLIVGWITLFLIGIDLFVVSPLLPFISDRNDLVIMLTMEAANAVGSVGGQRCCKRSAYLAISAAVEFVKRHLGTEMETEEFVCRYSNKNSSCLTEDCPFNEHYIEF